MVASLIPFVAATFGAICMALAFPKTNAAVLAPLGAVALFWAWFGVSPKRAFWAGWLAGTVFFSLTFRWFGETAGALIAPFGFALALGPAIVESFIGFGLVGALVAYAASALGSRDRLTRALVPPAAAAAFAAGEWVRGEGMGVFGLPFGALGYTHVTSPFAPLAAFGGSYAITFALCVLAAYAAYAVRMRAVRGSGLDASAGAAATVACVALAWLLWPARALPPATYRVAAIQGNIPQSLKFAPPALDEAVDRYEALSLAAAAAKPVLIVWPETVVPVALNEFPQLRARFAALAKRTRAELVVGTNDTVDQDAYNALYFFTPDGAVDSIYRKRRLVPFAERLPYGPLFAWIPWARNASHFSEGASEGLVPVAGMRFGPIVCWESAFSNLVRGDVRHGASALIVSTDDAWFGSTAGPYQHAQIAQMRALETGRWVVRAASTGISGIIAPNGRYTQSSALNERAVVAGTIGPPVDTPYDRMGGMGVAALLAAVYLLALGRGRTMRLAETRSFEPRKAW